MLPRNFDITKANEAMELQVAVTDLVQTYRIFELYVDPSVSDAVRGYVTVFVGKMPALIKKVLEEGGFHSEKFVEILETIRTKGVLGGFDSVVGKFGSPAEFNSADVATSLRLVPYVTSTTALMKGCVKLALQARELLRQPK